MELIPAIDLKGGRCVRLVRGDFAAETRYPVTPEALYERYAAVGARRLHVVDLDGARDGVPAHIEAIEALARLGRLRLQVGGGLRTRTALERMLKNGVARVVIGSLAVTDPSLVAGWLREFGPDSVVLAFDVRLDAGGTPRIATHGWARQSPLALWDAVEGFLAAELRHVLCTDVDRDGALAGPNTELYAEAVQRFPAIEWQASGGIRDTADLCALAAAGAAVAVSGRALLEQRLETSELQPFLPAA